MYSPKRRFRLFRDPAFASFNPSLFGDLTLWLDAGDVAGTGTNPSDGSIVTTWVDKSGLSNDATKFGNPTLSTTGVNGKAALSFDGTSMGFRGPIINSGTVSTTFVVATLNEGTPVNGRLISFAGDTGTDYNNASFLVPLLRDGAGQGISTYYAGGQRSIKSIPTYDTAFCATALVDGTNNIDYVNGVAGTTVAMSATFAITKYGVGIQPNSDGDYWKGYISEVLVYNSALSTTNRESVELYLATKWGISF